MTDGAVEDVQSFIDVGRFDWYETRHGRQLHYADLSGITKNQAAGIAENWALPGPVRLACGRTTAGLWIPGLGARLAAQRCEDCCAATGYPPGKGSPKNDAACRAVLGI